MNEMGEIRLGGCASGRQISMTRCLWLLLSSTSHSFYRLFSALQEPCLPFALTPCHSCSTPGQVASGLLTPLICPLHAYHAALPSLRGDVPILLSILFTLHVLLLVLRRVCSFIGDFLDSLRHLWLVSECPPLHSQPLQHKCKLMSRNPKRVPRHAGGAVGMALPYWECTSSLGCRRSSWR